MRDIKISVKPFDGFSFAFPAHDQGNDGGLVPKPEEISAESGILLYMNINGRIRDAVTQAQNLGTELIEDVHSIGPRGFRALLRNSEGNRTASHSEVNT